MQPYENPCKQLDLRFAAAAKCSSRFHLLSTQVLGSVLTQLFTTARSVCMVTVSTEDGCFTWCHHSGVMLICCHDIC